MKRAIIGAAYGVILGLPIFVIAGFGHGLFFPAAFVAAPLILLPGSLLFLPLLTALAAWTSAYRLRWPYLSLAAIHYVSAVILGCRTYLEEHGNPYAHFPELLHQFIWWTAALGVLYLLGNVLLWRTFAKSSHAQLSS